MKKVLFLLSIIAFAFSDILDEDDHPSIGISSQQIKENKEDSEIQVSEPLKGEKKPEDKSKGSAFFELHHQQKKEEPQGKSDSFIRSQIKNKLEKRAKNNLIEVHSFFENLEPDVIYSSSIDGEDVYWTFYQEVFYLLDTKGAYMFLSQDFKNLKDIFASIPQDVFWSFKIKEIGNVGEKEMISIFNKDFEFIGKIKKLLKEKREKREANEDLIAKLKRKKKAQNEELKRREEELKRREENLKKKEEAKRKENNENKEDKNKNKKDGHIISEDSDHTPNKKWQGNPLKKLKEKVPMQRDEKKKLLKEGAREDKLRSEAKLESEDDLIKAINEMISQFNEEKNKNLPFYVKEPKKEEKANEKTISHKRENAIKSIKSITLQSAFAKESKAHLAEKEQTQ